MSEAHIADVPKRSPQRHALKDRKDDCYETAPQAIHALLKVEPVPDPVWDPCCGPGVVVKLLRATGRVVHASDLVDYGLEDSTSRIDFLMEWRAPPGTQAVITNPPNKLATEFAEHALLLCPRVMLLQPIQFLGSAKTDADPRWRRASAGARDQASLADDAQARLEGPQKLKPNLLRVVYLESRALRPDDS